MKYPYSYSMKHVFQKAFFNTYYNSYEVNIVFFYEQQFKQTIYLFIININTNLLTIQRIISKDNYEIIKWINIILTQVQIKGLIFDCESRLNSNELHKYFINHHIQTYSSISQYTNHNRIIDRVIITIHYVFDHIKTDKI